EDDESQFEITVRAPEGASLRATERIANAVADKTRDLGGVDYAMVTVAGDGQKTQNLATIYVRLAEIEKRKASQQDLMEEVRKEVLPKFDGRGLRLGVQTINVFGSGGKNTTIQYVLSGPEMHELMA